MVARSAGTSGRKPVKTHRVREPRVPRELLRPRRGGCRRRPGGARRRAASRAAARRPARRWGCPLEPRNIATEPITGDPRPSPRAVSGARRAEREGLEVHAGRDRDHALGRRPRRHDHPPDRLPARDHAVGEPAVDRVEPASDRDRDVAGADHRHAAERAAMPPSQASIELCVCTRSRARADQPDEARRAARGSRARACGSTAVSSRRARPAPAGVRRADRPAARASRARRSSAPR